MMLGELIKKRRNELGMSRNALAVAAGISHTEINRIETGDRKQPSVKVLNSLASALSISQEDLMKVIATSDLYVHPSDIEIEAISCVEAFRCGLVPIISNNPKCATQQFALDEKCIFEHGDSDDLAKKIDYFIEHEEEKRELSKKYIEYGKQFTVENSVEQLENMFITAIRENTK